jgi:hypothetical protein
VLISNPTQSLWAIPNILEHATQNAFIDTAIGVGVATYPVVFNLDTLSSRYKKTYHARRKKIIERMMKEQSPSWSEMGDRFQEFKPATESKVPSE